MTAKLMSRSICFEPISKSALYQGTTSVVPLRAIRTKALESAWELEFYEFSPEGTAELSPGRQSWVGVERTTQSRRDG
jgi:hypothetical protein